MPLGLPAQPRPGAGSSIAAATRERRQKYDLVTSSQRYVGLLRNGFSGHEHGRVGQPRGEGLAEAFTQEVEQVGEAIGFDRGLGSAGGIAEGSEEANPQRHGHGRHPRSGKRPLVSASLMALPSVMEKAGVSPSSAWPNRRSTHRVAAPAEHS